MKIFYMLCAIVLALVVAPIAAFAATAEPTTAEAVKTIGLPWGDWVGAVVDFAATVALPIALAFLARLFAILPGPVVQILRTFQVEQLIQRAIDFGINATKGATKGQVLTVDVGSAVVATALQYVLDKAPAQIIKWIGGELRLREMILARLTLEEAADISVAVAR